MRRIFFNFLICFIAVFYAELNAEEHNGSPEDLFYKSNKLFKENRYSEAIKSYLELIESGQRSGHLYYNLGNAYFHLNMIGHTILYYEKAYLLIPRDADLNYNLRYARQQTKDITEETQSFISMTFFWLNSVTLGETILIFIIINVIFWTFLILRLYFKEEWSYYLLIILLIVWILSGASLGLKYYKVQLDNRAVILPKEINVLSGPDSNDTILFKLHAGTIVYLERDEDNWRLISLPDKKRGWVKSDSLGIIKF
ncbi:MAG: SH3 domain-containing protein [Spirochaetota bacterium]|nr:SH3 domain-containing protein [Spirochaetota bacterium]